MPHRSVHHRQRRGPAPWRTKADEARPMLEVAIAEGKVVIDFGGVLFGAVGFDGEEAVKLGNTLIEMGEKLLSMRPGEGGSADDG